MHAHTRNTVIFICIVSVLILELGCNPILKVTPGSPTITNKTPKKAPCKVHYQKKGQYCMVIVARCRAKQNRAPITIVSIAVLNTADNGKRAAKESLFIMLKYFRGRPVLQLLTMGNAKGVPIYLFIVKGVGPLLPRLPGSKPKKVKLKSMNF